jgi:hypothetical protein
LEAAITSAIKHMNDHFSAAWVPAFAGMTTLTFLLAGVIQGLTEGGSLFKTAHHPIILDCRIKCAMEAVLSAPAMEEGSNKLLITGTSRH